MLENKCENFKLLLKFNYSSSKLFSIKSELLEKGLILHYKKTNDHDAHMTSDLEAFYDSKLPNFEGLVKESIGVNRNLIK